MVALPRAPLGVSSDKHQALDFALMMALARLVSTGRENSFH